MYKPENKVLSIEQVQEGDCITNGITVYYVHKVKKDRTCVAWVYPYGYNGEKSSRGGYKGQKPRDTVENFKMSRFLYLYKVETK